MFSSHKKLIKRTGNKGVSRPKYLELLVNEFQESNSPDARYQVLANLANFAYDPINYEFLWELKVIDLFLDQLSEDDPTLVHYGLAGLCNLCLDHRNKDYILENDGVRLVVNCLSSSNEETVLNAITTLMFLVTPKSKPEITSVEIIDCMLRVSCSRNTRLRNLAVVFLEDYCTKDQVVNVKALQEHQKNSVVNIPLPPQQPPSHS